MVKDAEPRKRPDLPACLSGHFAGDRIVAPILKWYETAAYTFEALASEELNGPCNTVAGVAKTRLEPAGVVLEDFASGNAEPWVGLEDPEQRFVVAGI